MTRERHRNLRALFVVIGLSIAAVCAVTLMMSAAYGKPKQGAIQQAAQKAVGEQTVPSTGRAASTAKKRKVKRYKLPIQFAFDVTHETALYAYLFDAEAFSYGAYGCKQHKKYSPYGAVCIGWVAGQTPNPDGSYTEWYCDWDEDVWISKSGAGKLKVRVYNFECFYGSASPIDPVLPPEGSS